MHMLSSWASVSREHLEHSVLLVALDTSPFPVKVSKGKVS